MNAFERSCDRLWDPFRGLARWLHDRVPPFRWLVHGAAAYVGDECDCKRNRHA
jgi:hypothetical protein